MATIREIAKIANVGVGTVSRALNGNGYVDNQKKIYIQKIAEELDYKPVKKSIKKTKKSGIVGVILPDVAQPFWGSFLRRVEKELLEKGYRTMIINSMGVCGRVTEAIDMVEKQLLDGIIVNSDVTQSEIERLRKIPTVSFECEMGTGIPLIASDHKKGGKVAANLLIQCGCKNVAIFSAKANTPVYARHRIEECSRMLKRNGVHVSLIETTGKQTSMKSIGETINDFMNNYTTVDGIFTDDIEAYWCLAQAKKRGILVPRDFKIIGYDGNQITRMISPQITTIVQNVSQLAKTCVEVLDKRMKGERTEPLYIVPIKLSKGGTTE